MSATFKLALAVIFAISVTALSIFGAVRSGTNIYKASIASPSWPSVTGEVRTSSVAKGCSKQKRYYPEVTYAYVVQGHSYVGDRIAFIKRFCGTEYAAQSLAAAQYRPGTTVLVYYDPKDPSDAVLTRGDSGGVLDFAFLLLFLAPISVAWLVVLGVHHGKVRWRTVDAETLRARQAALDDGIQKEIAERTREKERARNQVRG